MGTQVAHAPADATDDSALQLFLQREQSRDLLRFATAGSVDDGKSTLIGRLLFDSGQVPEDQIRAVEGKGEAGAGVPNLALLTDGLRAEREAGITIDVAYRYFSSARRRFILADTPGHAEYTRNMVTGASTADAVLVLVDAVRGIAAQTRRHAWITALLRVPSLVLAVNKMDLADYSQARFCQIQSEFLEFFNRVEGHEHITVYPLPLSALHGDNVVRASTSMPWFRGNTLLGLLDDLPAYGAFVASAPFRMAVQRVSQTPEGFTGYAGQIVSGTLRPGDLVRVQGSRDTPPTARVTRIVTFDGDLEFARAPQSITVTLDGDAAPVRGDLLVEEARPCRVSSNFAAYLVWMGEQDLVYGRRYLLKNLARTVSVRVLSLSRQLPLTGDENPTPEVREAGPLRIHEAGLAWLETEENLAIDLYSDNRATGSFILVDGDSHATVAAGMVQETLPERAFTGGLSG